MGLPNKPLYEICLIYSRVAAFFSNNCKVIKDYKTIYSKSFVKYLSSLSIIFIFLWMLKFLLTLSIGKIHLHNLCSSKPSKLIFGIVSLFESTNNTSRKLLKVLEVTNDKRIAKYAIIHLEMEGLPTSINLKFLDHA